ncbi:hypothetical protein EE612_048919 [Oryza sativa]|nr:hypothetical protein EE612_048919 [Oryza sativa]
MDVFQLQDQSSANLLINSSIGISAKLPFAVCSYCKMNSFVVVPFLVNEYAKCSSRRRKLDRLISVLRSTSENANFWRTYGPVSSFSKSCPSGLLLPCSLVLDVSISFSKRERTFLPTEPLSSRHLFLVESRRSTATFEIGHMAMSGESWFASRASAIPHASTTALSVTERFTPSPGLPELFSCWWTILEYASKLSPRVRDAHLKNLIASAKASCGNCFRW